MVKRPNQESNPHLSILGFERDVIELAFSEAPFGSSLGVRGRVAHREAWAAGSPLSHIRKPRTPETVPRPDFHHCRRRTARFHKVEKRLRKFINDGSLLNY